jgi:GNAT superfamily N-acetyltransferase
MCKLVVMDLALRLLNFADIPGGMRLKAAAGWNQTESDWRNLLALAPGSCFGIESGGELRATTTAICYGRELAWIGMVLTDPAYRGRGLARRLMEHTLEYLRRERVHWIKLDATAMGRPVYERLGFRDEAVIERWVRKPGRVREHADSTGPFVLDAALDREAFGADRAPLLRAVAGIEATSIAGAGFAMGRAGSTASYFGPCVARSKDAARDLLTWFLAKHGEESVYWDILAANGVAIELARESGFERARELTRMSLAGVDHPTPLQKKDALVFGAAGFEYG